MRTVRLLLVATALGTLIMGADSAAAAACTSSTYVRTGSTLTITPGASCSLTVYATGSDAYMFAADIGSTWSGAPGVGLSPFDHTLAALSAGIDTITIADAPGAPSTVSIAGLAQAGIPVPWIDALTVNQTQPGSATVFSADTGLTAPISFGTVAVSVTSPSITVAQEIADASQIFLHGTTDAPLIRASMTASGSPGTITATGARIRNVGVVTLTATRTTFSGDVVGVTSCAGVDASLCSTGPATLAIAGALTAEGSMTSLSQLIVSGDAVLGGDVSTAATQSWQGRVYVTKAGRLTLTGPTVSTPKGIEQYAGPCGLSEIAGCSIGPATPPSTFSALTVDGAWLTGGLVGATDSITATGLTTVTGDGLYAPFSTTTSGPQDYLGGLSILLPRSAVLSGSTITIAGMPEAAAAGAIKGAACDTGPVTVIGDLRLTAAVACAGSLNVNGATTIAADVSTEGYQSYHGPVTIALGSGTIRLRAPAGQQVSFPDTTVAATWSAASGDVAGYSASIAPTGQSCTTTGALTCSFGAVPSGADLVFSATPLRPVAAAGAPSTSRGTGTAAAASTLRRTVARGSQTPLARLIEPPATRGRRVWAERGPCTIDDGRLIAPRRRASCTLTLQVRRNGKTAWSGRALIAVR